MITRRDIYFALATGVVTGTIAWRLFVYLSIPRPYDVSFAWLIAVVPLLWIAGRIFGHILQRYIPAMDQFSKFVAIGFTNAAIDFGYLNILIAHTGFRRARGLRYLRPAHLLSQTSIAIF